MYDHTLLRGLAFSDDVVQSSVMKFALYFPLTMSAILASIEKLIIYLFRNGAFT